MIGLIIYIKLKPGTQMIPPFWKLEERMNWKPTLFFWVNMLIISLFLINLKN